MSARSASLVRSFKVGRYDCTLTFPPLHPGAVLAMSAEWWPSAPEQLTTDEIAEYRNGRNRALEDLATVLGGNVAVVE